jgi:hypothetical protein
MTLVMPSDEKASANAISMDMKRNMITAEPLILSRAHGNRSTCQPRRGSSGPCR